MPFRLFVVTAMSIFSTVIIEEEKYSRHQAGKNDQGISQPVTFFWLDDKPTPMQQFLFLFVDF